MNLVFGRSIWLIVFSFAAGWPAGSTGAAQDPPPEEPEGIVVPQPAEQVDPPRPYGYDRRDWDERVEAAKIDGEKKTAELAKRWFQATLAVGYINTVARRGFPHSMEFWSTGKLRSGTITRRSDRDLFQPVHYDSAATVTVRSDCLSDIVITQDADLVHIYGDLRGRVEVTGDVEVLIGGNVHRRGEIITHGSASIFIGGDVEGVIRNDGDALIWVNGDHNGRITTGNGQTDLVVMGSYNGLVYPEDNATALYLTVHGYMHSNSMRGIAQYSYELLRGSVGFSDLAAAFHPRTYNPKIGKWAVHHQVELKSPDQRQPDNGASPETDEP